MMRGRLAIGLTALLLVAGCSTPSGGTAFEVDGNAVSQQQVDRATKGCATVAQQDASQIRSQVAQFLLYGQLADAMSKRTNIAITPGMQSTAYTKLGLQQLAADPDCNQAGQGLARFGALAEKLGKQRLATELKQVQVKVNPAYGNWDSNTAMLTGTSGSLSRQDLGDGKVFG